MANPRQRSKGRSGSYKPVHHAKRAKKLLKKHPPIRGPKVLQDAWDNHKTVKQNYAALGLVASLNPTASGGTERERYPPQSVSSDLLEARISGDRIPKGYGRLIKDGDGNVIDIELEETDVVETMQQDRGQDIYDLDRTSLDQNSMNWVQLGPNNGLPRSDANSVVRELEKISAPDCCRVPRFLSGGEWRYLQRLVAKHKEDFEAMSKDRKLNPEQRTAGTLGRAIRRAGGHEKLTYSP